MLEKLPISKRLLFLLHGSDLEWNGNSSGLGGRLLHDALPAVECALLAIEFLQYGVPVKETCLLSCGVSFCFIFCMVLDFYLFDWVYFLI